MLFQTAGEVSKRIKSLILSSCYQILVVLSNGDRFHLEIEAMTEENERDTALKR